MKGKWCKRSSLSLTSVTHAPWVCWQWRLGPVSSPGGVQSSPSLRVVTDDSCVVPPSPPGCSTSSVNISYITMIPGIAVKCYVFASHYLWRRGWVLLQIQELKCYVFTSHFLRRRSWVSYKFRNYSQCGRGKMMGRRSGRKERGKGQGQGQGEGTWLGRGMGKRRAKGCWRRGRWRER